MFNSLEIISLLKQKAERLLNVPGSTIIFNGSRVKDSFCMISDVTICDILSPTLIQLRTKSNRVTSFSLNNIVDIKGPSTINSALSVPKYFEDPDPYGEDYNFQNNLRIINRAMDLSKDIEMVYKDETYVVNPMVVYQGQRNYYLEALDYKDVQKNKIFNIKNMKEVVAIKKVKKHVKNTEDTDQNVKLLKQCIRSKTEVEITFDNDSVVYALPLSLKNDKSGDLSLVYFSYNSEYPNQVSFDFIKSVLKMNNNPLQTNPVTQFESDENKIPPKDEFTFEVGQRLQVLLKNKEEVIDIHVVNPKTLGVFVDGKNKNIKKSDIMCPQIIEHNIFRKRRS